MNEIYEEQLEAAKRFVRSIYPKLSEEILVITAAKVVKTLPKVRPARQLAAKCPTIGGQNEVR